MAKKCYKSSVDKKFAGVCGGIGEYFDIDPTLVRLIWVVLTLAGGAGLLAYIIAACVMPEAPAGGYDPYNRGYDPYNNGGYGPNNGGYGPNNGGYDPNTNGGYNPNNNGAYAPNNNGGYDPNSNPDNFSR